MDIRQSRVNNVLISYSSNKIGPLLSHFFPSFESDLREKCVEKKRLILFLFISKLYTAVIDIPTEAIGPEQGRLKKAVLRPEYEPMSFPLNFTQYVHQN